MGAPECVPCHSTSGSVFQALVTETMFPNIAGSRSCIDCHHVAGRTFSK
ncbi:hypothetical protein J5I49_25405, partial [Escherichia coli]|nr:hypothetical protein [Escherichia coli]